MNNTLNSLKAAVDADEPGLHRILNSPNVQVLDAIGYGDGLIRL